MLINQSTAILSPKILLVPYESHHVPTYHDWMQDVEIQNATASDPLTVEEEYAMQRSWRQDSDKLTFISCLAPPTSDARIIARQQDASDRMLGDVNLFLTRLEAEDKEGVIGEIELMIASKESQGKGCGRASLMAFMKYIASHEEEILAEYMGERGPAERRLRYLRVKIGQGNVRSIGLFKSIGFVVLSEEPNYFGEVELRKEGIRIAELESLQSYRELEYILETKASGEEP